MVICFLCLLVLFHIFTHYFCTATVTHMLLKKVRERAVAITDRAVNLKSCTVVRTA